MSKLIQNLVSFGLTEKEASSYLALYKLGEATAYQVAKESGVKRPTVYVIMEELRKRGLALIVPHATKQVFLAKNPHEFIREFQSRTNENMRSLLASLPSLSHPDTNTIIFKGPGALVQGLSYGLRGLKDKEMIAFYAPVKKGVKIGSEYLDHVKQRHEVGFKLRSIVPTVSDDKIFRDLDKKYGYRSKKISSQVFNPEISIEVCGDLTKTIIHNKREVIVVRDQGVADFYRQVFEMLWEK